MSGDLTLEPRVLLSGLGFPEGPVFLGDGAVAFVEMQNARLSRYEAGDRSTIAETAPGPNGATLAADGSFWVMINGGLSLGSKGYWFSQVFTEGRVQHVAHDGTVSSIELPGEPAHRPNDGCFGPDGMLYVTDPRNWESFAELQTGRIWRVDPTTGSAEILAELPLFPNGIAFGPDNRLYVAQTVGMKIFVFDWSPAGLGDPSEFVTLPRGFPDGFCFATNGDAYVTGATGDVLHVFDADGELKKTIDLPEGSDPTNCCIGDGSLFVTASTSGELLAFDVGVEPLPLYPFRPSAR